MNLFQDQETEMVLMKLTIKMWCAPIVLNILPNLPRIMTGKKLFIIAFIIQTLWANSVDDV